MTRENKLAMVVGFGLLLFVGILLSDHFSAAQRQDTARLSTADRNRDRPAPPISIAPMPAAGVAIAQQTETMPTGGSDVRQASAVTPISSAPELARATLKPVDPVAPIGTKSVGKQESEPGVRLRPIAEGETLYAICKKEYGDGSVAGALAKYNQKAVPDPTKLRKGVTLRLPPIEVLKPGAKSNRAQAKAEQVPAATTPVETIAAADVTTVESKAPVGGVVNVDLPAGGVKEGSGGAKAKAAAKKPKNASTKAAAR
ncbi:MAG: LysM peptidoglycan-binding domain-containing protein [Planctomycetota bacterium]